jgi:uncharacterized membrane protein YccC
MPYKKPDFIPDCIAEMTATSWGRLFTETPTYKPPASEKYRLTLRAGWPSDKPRNQAQIQQSLLSLWPDLFEDIEKSATALEHLGRENYDAILALTLNRETPGDDLARIQTYATAMAMVIVAQRELLTAVMPNIRQDTKRGFKMIENAEEGGRKGQRKLQEKRARVLERRDQEIAAMRQKHPGWSQSEIARHVARICDEKPDTIRRHIGQNKERLGF